MKFRTIISEVLATFALMSCSRAELVQTENHSLESGKYEIVATVNGASSMSVGTKAIQTGWVDGDKIFVFSEDCGTGYITLQYNATTAKWEFTTTGIIDPFFTDTEKKVCAIFVPFADSNLTPTFAGGTWTIDTGDVFYTYDSDVEVTRVRPHYLNMQITLQVPADYVQIFIDKARLQNVFTRTHGEDVKLTCNQIDRYDKVTLTGTTFTEVKNTSDSKITPKELNVGSNSGIVFYGKRNTKTGKANFTITGGAVTYTYTTSSAISSGAYNLTETGWKQLLPAKFEITVSGTTYTVQFAPGNLQANYNGNNPKWRFAEEQYETIGSQDISKYKTKTGGAYPWYDLFGWGATGKAEDGKTAVPFWTVGTSGAAAQQAKFRGDLNPTSGDLTLSLDGDWGANEIENAQGKTYQTLTKAQWNALFTKYTPKISYIKTDDGVIHYGAVIVPSGITAKASYTISAWRTAEKDGAVFFPSAGARNGNESTSHNGKVTSTYDGFYYWSRTLSSEYGGEQGSATTKYGLPYGFGYYGSGNWETFINWRSTGRAVRLAEVKKK